MCDALFEDNNLENNNENNILLQKIIGPGCGLAYESAQMTDITNTRIPKNINT